ncbi:MAG: hypothetical protein QXR30_03690 [Candidatus Woesearchaeota archaeon]
MSDNDFTNKFSDTEEMIEEMIDIPMFKNVIHGVLDYSIDAVNFPSLNKVFYLYCYMTEKGKEFLVSDNIPFIGRILH